MKWESELIKKLGWSEEIKNLDKKQKIADELAAKVKEGDVIGFGSGSTSYLASLAIGKRAKEENLNITAIPTSYEIGLSCSILGIPTASLLQSRPDWAFDGADEVDENNSLIKGRGGAMFKEKLVMQSAKKTYILVDESKFVKSLGEKFAVPIEVMPDALLILEEKLRTLGVTDMALRLAKSKDGPVITETGNLILDVRFKKIEPNYEGEIKKIPGVIESGLFIGYNVEILKA